MKVPWVDEVELSSLHIVELLIQIRDSCTQIGPKSLAKLRVPIVEVRREKNIFVRIMVKLLKRTTNTYQIPKEFKRTMNLFLFQLRRSNYCPSNSKYQRKRLQSGRQLSNKWTRVLVTNP